MQNKATISRRHKLCHSLLVLFLASSACDDPTDVDDTVDSLAIVPNALSIAGIGTTQQLAVRAVDADGRNVANAAISWSSMTQSVATTSTDGRITSVSDGQAIISAQSGALTAYALVTVYVQDTARTRTWSWTDETFYIHEDIWGYDSNHLLAVGWYGTVAKYDGTKWDSTGVTIPDDRPLLWSVWGSSPQSAWAVGQYGVIEHYDGAVWTRGPRGVAGGSLYGIWGCAPDDIWAVGQSQAIVHYDGTSWTSVSKDVPGRGLSDVWGTGADNIWSVGWKGTILHYDGSTWSLTAPELTSETLRSVWGSSSSDIWAVGDSGTIVHYDGAEWAHVSTSVTDAQLQAVWGSGPANVWVVGVDGTILSFNGNEWSDLSLDSSTNHLAAIWGRHDTDLWIVANISGSGYVDITPILRGSL